MAQPTPEELARMSLEELDTLFETLDPVTTSAGLQRALYHYYAKRTREKTPPLRLPSAAELRARSAETLPLPSPTEELTAEQEHEHMRQRAWKLLEYFRSKYQPLGLEEFQAVYDIVAEHEQRPQDNMSEGSDRAVGNV